MGEGLIVIRMKDDKIEVKTKLTNLKQGELSMVITHLDIIKEDVFNQFKKGVSMVHENI